MVSVGAAIVHYIIIKLMKPIWRMLLIKCICTTIYFSQLHIKECASTLCVALIKKNKKATHTLDKY